MARSGRHDLDGYLSAKSAQAWKPSEPAPYDTAVADQSPIAAAALNAARPQLRLVTSSSVAASEWSWFCGHCGAQREGPTPAPIARVCADCGLGLLLEARSEVVPNLDDAFLVVDSSLSVQAMSQQAELALGLREGDAVNRHITELLIPAAAENNEPFGLAVAITRAARGDGEAVNTFVRPTRTFGVRLEARIATCGPPRAALIVLR